jgi:hypothetical protein
VGSGVGFTLVQPAAEPMMVHTSNHANTRGLRIMRARTPPRNYRIVRDTRRCLARGAIVCSLQTGAVPTTSRRWHRKEESIP